MIKNFIFLGAPGVGKGSAAVLIAEEKGLLHISTGEIFRNEIKNETKLGLEVKAIIASGSYVPDDVTNAIVKGAISTPEALSRGFILDGYPRTVNQSEFLKSENIVITNAVLLEAPEDVVIKRLLGRGRADDDATIIKKRIDVYNTETKPLIDWYENEGLLVRIDASGPIPENIDNIKKAVY